MVRVNAEIIVPYCFMINGELGRIGDNYQQGYA